MRLVNRVANPDEVATAAANALAERLVAHSNSADQLHLSITGGSVGILTLAKLALVVAATPVDWSNVHIWWGDDRFVEADSADSNALQAREALLALIDIPAGNVHAFPTFDAGSDIPKSAQLDAAAAAFTAEVAKYASAQTGLINFDITVLGMGPDGHIASLFPGHQTPPAGVPIIAEHNSPKPPPERLSFSYEAINNSQEIWFVVAGADKSDAVSVAFSQTPQDLPVGRVSGKNQTIWFIDQAAAAGIPN